MRDQPAKPHVPARKYSTKQKPNEIAELLRACRIAAEKAGWERENIDSVLGEALVAGDDQLVPRDVILANLQRHFDFR